MMTAECVKTYAATGRIFVDDNGEVVGAVGVSGGTSDEDEAIALVGIEAAGLAHQG